jgi:uncharacterized membrane protein HdeD (DUF308 family)
MPGQSLTNEEIRESTSAWWLFLVAGLISIAAGVVVIAKPEDSLATLAVIAGIFVLIDGIVDLAVSIKRSTENRGLAAILGVVGVVVGVLPIGGVLAIALLIGIWLIAIGVVRLVGAFERDNVAWRLLVAVIEIAAGIVIVSSPPISFATLALIVGISFIANGVGIFALGWVMHVLRRDAAGPPVGAGVPA